MANTKERIVKRVIRCLHSFYYGKNESYRIDISARKECNGFITELYVQVNYYNECDSRLFISVPFWVKFPRIAVNSWGNRRKEPLKLHFIDDGAIRSGTKLAKWAEYTVNCANERFGFTKRILECFSKCNGFQYFLSILSEHIHTSGYPFSSSFLHELDRLITEYNKSHDRHYSVEICSLVRHKMKHTYMPGDKEISLLKNIDVTLMLLQRNRNKAKYEKLLINAN